MQATHRERAVNKAKMSIEGGGPREQQHNNRLWLMNWDLHLKDWSLLWLGLTFDFGLANKLQLGKRIFQSKAKQTNRKIRFSRKFSFGQREKAWQRRLGGRFVIKRNVISSVCFPCFLVWKYRLDHQNGDASASSHQPRYQPKRDSQCSLFNATQLINSPGGGGGGQVRSVHTRLGHANQHLNNDHRNDNGPPWTLEPGGRPLTNGIKHSARAFIRSVLHPLPAPPVQYRTSTVAVTNNDRPPSCRSILDSCPMMAPRSWIMNTVTNRLDRHDHDDDVRLLLAECTSPSVELMYYFKNGWVCPVQSVVLSQTIMITSMMMIAMITFNYLLLDFQLSPPWTRKNPLIASGRSEWVFLVTNHSTGLSWPTSNGSTRINLWNDCNYGAQCLLDPRLAVHSLTLSGARDPRPENTACRLAVRLACVMCFGPVAWMIDRTRTENGPEERLEAAPNTRFGCTNYSMQIGRANGVSMQGGRVTTINVTN